MVTGVVVHGEKRGRAIGFPTANLELPSGVELPPDGIYAGIARTDRQAGVYRAAAISVGTNPTFDGEYRTVEAYLLDFDGDLYGKRLSVRAIRRLRGMQRFDGVLELIQAMRRDVLATRELIAQVAPDALAVMSPE